MGHLVGILRSSNFYATLEKSGGRSSHTTTQQESPFISRLKHGFTKSARGLKRDPRFYTALKEAHALTKQQFNAWLQKEGLKIRSDWDDESFWPWYWRRKYLQQLFVSPQKRLEQKIPKPRALPSNQFKALRDILKPDSRGAKGAGKGAARKSGKSAVRAIVSAAKDVAAFLFRPSPRPPRWAMTGTGGYVLVTPARKPKPWELEL